MKSVCLVCTVFLLFGFIYCEDEPCDESEGCYLDPVDPKYVDEMNSAFAEKQKNVKVKEIKTIVRMVKDTGVFTKSEILSEDGKACTVTWTEPLQHEDNWIPDMDVNCENPPPLSTEIPTTTINPSQ
ncbi:hypothetical protein GE061_006898 [Apolygus lucorum]|uniref:Uncharacterized protein n=1 Tax=Apolygus lucorum TaxID=248454 RepID=A0A6A4J1X4_APOLU|nr:hypothetical protein GE061_006898 [Apolygus lucorum]